MLTRHVAEKKKKFSVQLRVNFERAGFESIDQRHDFVFFFPVYSIVPFLRETGEAI